MKLQISVSLTWWKRWCLYIHTNKQKTYKWECPI